MYNATNAHTERYYENKKKFFSTDGDHISPRVL